MFQSNFFEEYGTPLPFDTDIALQIYKMTNHFNQVFTADIDLLSFATQGFIRFKYPGTRINQLNIGVY